MERKSQSMGEKLRFWGIMIAIFYGLVSFVHSIQGSPNITVISNPPAIQYYPVEGTSAFEIWDSLEANTIKNPGSAKALSSTKDIYVGMVQPEISWQHRYCGLSVVLDYDVYLPKHKTPERFSPKQLSRWERWVGEVTAHENNHIKIFRDNLPLLEATLAGMECSALEFSAEEAIDTWLEHVDALQAGFHEMVESQEEQARRPFVEELDQLEDQYSQYELNLESLETQIIALTRRIELHSNPHWTNWEFERLHSERDRVIWEYDSLIVQANEIAKHINQLNEQLFWITEYWPVSTPTPTR